eukprot:GHVP01062059.1.p2 GENE.GHVP01062059.1~~GHVP01062059.1.p2  ORF type:complete len:545 (-),score=103.16 GHVP01062059.1:3648-5282(-)
MIRAVESNNTKIYDLTSTYEESPLYKLKRHSNEDSEAKPRHDKKKVLTSLDFIHDMRFPIGSTKVRISNDGEYIGACGIYPPSLSLYETRQLSLKCSRGLDCEIQDFLFLSDDYKKLALLGLDRSIEFHSQAGRYHKIRLPKAGRGIAYSQTSAELYAACSSPDIYRLDLEEGRFLSPLESNLEFNSFCLVHPTHLPLLATGGANNEMEFWDTRASNKMPIKRLTVESEPSWGDEFEDLPEVTCAAFSTSGMDLAVGTTEGVVRMYDIRSKDAVCSRNHHNSTPIIDVKFAVLDDVGASSELVSRHSARTVISADENSIKIWTPDFQCQETSLVVSLDSPSKITSLAQYPKSGLLFFSRDSPRMGAYLIPALGMAPKFASQLDSFTEELEESAHAVYEDVRFIDAGVVTKLGIQHLVGTPSLKPYMHGYFIKRSAYSDLTAALAEVDIENYKKKKIQEKMDAKKVMRLAKKPKSTREAPAANKKLFERLNEALEAEEDAPQSTKKRSRKQKMTRDLQQATNLLVDPRYAEIFNNPEFEIQKISK